MLSPSDIYHPEDAALLEKEYRATLASGRPTHRTFRLRSKHFDRPRWFELFIQPDRDDAGNTTGIAVAAFDVTRYQEVKRTLSEREALLRMALEAADMADWDYNVRTGMIRHSERLFRIHEMLSGSALSDVGSLLKRVHSDDARLIRKKICSALKADAHQLKFDYRITEPDGSTRWIASRAQIIRDRAGKIERITGIDMDITRERGALETLRHAYDALEQFAYAASHDLKEPLRTVSAFASLLNQRLDSRLTSEERTFLAHIRAGTSKMQELIDGLLGYAIANKAEHDRQPVNLDNLLQECVQELDAIIEEAEAEISWKPLPTVHANRLLLRHVIQNLLCNAIKFRANRRPPVIRIDCAGTDKGWEISVTDNGIGIPPHELESVFEPFRRLRNAAGSSGSGLGLAIARRAITAHGGQIWAESRARGTVIRFTLPQVMAEQQSAQSFTEAS